MSVALVFLCMAGVAYNAARHNWSAMLWAATAMTQAMSLMILRTS